jgi:hypothetical protein
MYLQLQQKYTVQTYHCAGHTLHRSIYAHKILRTHVQTTVISSSNHKQEDYNTLTVK